MRKQQFFESVVRCGNEPQQEMNFGSGQSQLMLNDLVILRMLFLDHFYLFMGMNSRKADGYAQDDPAAPIADQTQFLFMMKDGKVRF